MERITLQGLLYKAHRTGDISGKGYSTKHTGREISVERITLQGLLYKTHRTGDISGKGYSTKHTGREISVQSITDKTCTESVSPRFVGLSRPGQSGSVIPIGRWPRPHVVTTAFTPLGGTIKWSYFPRSSVQCASDEDWRQSWGKTDVPC